MVITMTRLEPLALPTTPTTSTRSADARRGRTARAVLLTAIAALASLGTAACGPGGDEIESFTIKTTTGAKGSDQDMYLCYTRGDNANRFECLDLSTSGNDFEANTRETFEAEPDDPIAIEDGPAPYGISDIFIENRGGGFGSDGWDLVALEIRAVYGDGSESELCSEPTLSVRLNSGDKYDPPDCP